MLGLIQLHVCLISVMLKQSIKVLQLLKFISPQRTVYDRLSGRLNLQRMEDELCNLKPAVH